MKRQNFKYYSFFFFDNFKMLMFFLHLYLNDVNKKYFKMHIFDFFMHILTLMIIFLSAISPKP